MIGKTINCFEDKLPRSIDVLRYYFHFQNASDTEKITDTTNQIKRMYNLANITTIHFESIRSKVKRLVLSVKSIIETRKSQNARQITKELSIFQSIVQLFEIAKNEELLPHIQKEFLADQRSVRRNLISELNVGVGTSFSNGMFICISIFWSGIEK